MSCSPQLHTTASFSFYQILKCGCTFVENHTRINIHSTLIFNLCFLWVFLTAFWNIYLCQDDIVYMNSGCCLDYEYLDSKHCWRNILIVCTAQGILQHPTHQELTHCVMILLSILILFFLHSKEAAAGTEAKTDFVIQIISIFPVYISGCQLKENTDISGTSVQVTFVKTTEECAKICSQTESCDSFWCYTHDPSRASGGVTKSCNLKRNGKYRKADHKTAGICSKGMFSYSDSMH